MDAAVARAETGVTGAMSTRQRQTIRLHMVRGSFFTADAVAGGGFPIMDARVWSRLPEELVWEVLKFVPAATHFQLHLVSRKWRQVLTSPTFRNRLSALASRQSEEQQHCVVAGLKPWRFSSSRASASARRKSSVVDVDLSSFVPRCFWKSDFYSVVAAGDGLVCISNSSEEEDHALEVSNPMEVWKPETMRFCVLNPLTRTCKLLPKAQFRPRGWLPPTRTAVTMFGWREGVVNVATYDLTASGSGGWDLAAYYDDGVHADERRWSGKSPKVALCAGETYLLHHCRLHVLAPGPGGRLVEVAALDEPSEALLGVDASASPYVSKQGHLVAHRGTVFFVNCVIKMPSDPGKMRGKDAVMRVWRLARQRLEWEAVGMLDVAKVKQLTGLPEVKRPTDLKSVHVKLTLLTCGMLRIWGACGAREFVYCWMDLMWGRVMLGLNLDTGNWELVHNEEGMMQQQRSRGEEESVNQEPSIRIPMNVSRLVELRPELFLAQDSIFIWCSSSTWLQACTGLRLFVLIDCLCQVIMKKCGVVKLVASKFKLSLQRGEA